MKIKFLFVVAVFTLIQLPYSIKAQENKFDVGIEAGPARASMRGNDIIKKYQDPMLGYSAGISVNYNFSRMLSFKSGIYTDLKGCSSEITMTDEAGIINGKHRINYNFQYLTVPLLVKISFGKKMKFFANAGPYLGYLVKYEVGKNLLLNANVNQDQTNMYTRFDGGVTMGMGVSPMLSKKIGISFEVRDNLGLTNIDGASYRPTVIKTNALTFMVGIAMKVGNKNAEEKK